MPGMGRVDLELRVFATHEEVLEICSGVKCIHVAMLRPAEVSRIDEAGAVNANFRAITKPKSSYCTTGTGSAAVEDICSARADLDIGDPISPQTIRDPAQQLRLFVTKVAVTRGAARLAAGVRHSHVEIVTSPKRIGLLPVRFDAPPRVAGAERIRRDVVDLGPFHERQPRRRRRSLEHEIWFDDTNVQMEMIDTRVG